MNIFFDTETTGLTPGNIIQLSYIMDGKDIVAKNFYFDVDSIPIEATKVHGVSTEMIHKLSGGKVFGDYIEEIKNDFSNAKAFVAHNIRFDVKFMESEFSKLKETFPERRLVDTCKEFKDICKIPSIKGFYKPPKLVEVGEFFKISDDTIEKFISKYFQVDGKKAHDARYDTSLMYLCVKKYQEQLDK